ncbi:DUF4199 domain-containing protein [Mucilaginibacter sp. UR6-11]|uniref:DUF4199 domain-containing protein n=1 Tax=Mucilaginibacter sp. UR6-11 TaxID=1435644 RepID=UPI001E2B120B|nr:DUF4199 domain-containing protein [Mucilaginibacter sp. UR6-11]MCC8425920.1 DUF4199 domain-containing protein [Mucilaginibacter sp. UR6-11]
MEDQTKKATIGKLGVRYGLLIGGISLVLSVVCRIVDPLMQFTNIWMQLLGGVIAITLLVVFGIEIRKAIGGYWSFGEAFRGLMTMAVFITLISVLYSFILFKFVDPDMPAKINDASERVMTERLAKMGMDQDKIDQVSKTFENGEFKAKLEPTFKNEATAFCFGLVFYAIINLIVAACIKKNQPLVVLDNAVDDAV